jgi:VanZ family protein
LRIFWEWLFGPVSNAHWEHIHHILRKSGHFLGYGAIGLTWLRAWRMSFPGSQFLQDALLALTGTALLASCDEYHQSFLPSRTSSAWDVLLDCCGALTMQLLIYLFLRLFRPRRLVNQVSD